MDIKNIELTFRFRWKRNARGISLENLSELTGISVSQLSDIERNKKMPSFDKIVKIALALDVGVNEIYEVKYKNE